MRYKLLVTDVDGTLIPAGGKLSVRNREALIRAQEEFNLRVALTSRRTPADMQELGEQLMLDKYGGYLLPERGSRCINCRSGLNIDFQTGGKTGKAPAIEHLMDKLDLVREEVVAVGDSESDVELLQMVGMGVAVANASELVKACADYVTKSAEEDGIAHLLEKYIFRSYEETRYTAEDINSALPGTLMESLGIQCTAVANGYVEAVMPVDRRTMQPMGILHGGANLALAETIAGFGSVALCESDEIQVGMQVSGNHVASAVFGDTVRAEATILHQGRSTHVWTVEIYSCKSGKLISTVRVLNSILKRR